MSAEEKIHVHDPLEMERLADALPAERAATLVLDCYSIDDATSGTTALPSIPRTCALPWP